jgi:hypothetical protein
MGYIEIVGLTSDGVTARYRGSIEIAALTYDGVTVTDLSDISDKIEQELWSALKRGDIK